MLKNIEMRISGFIKSPRQGRLWLAYLQSNTPIANIFFEVASGLL